MKLTLSHNDKSWLSFDLKDLMWLTLVVAVCLMPDWRTKYTANVLKWNEQLQEKIGQQNLQYGKLQEQLESNKPRIANVVHIEDEVLADIKNGLKEYNSMATYDRMYWYFHFQDYLNSINRNRDFLTAQLRTLKKPNDNDLEKERELSEAFEALETPDAKVSNAFLIKVLDENPQDVDDYSSAQRRAAAIDLLGARKTEEAIPHLIECLSDGRALIGSDNWVGGHAANALESITGRPFSINQNDWRQWWKNQTHQ
jgi:hypothetical protein